MPSSAPAPAEGGSGQGSCGSLLAVVSLGATGDRLDPVSPHQKGRLVTRRTWSYRHTSIWQQQLNLSPTVASPVVRRRSQLLPESFRWPPGAVDAAAAGDVAKPYMCKGWLDEIRETRMGFFMD